MPGARLLLPSYALLLCLGASGLAELPSRLLMRGGAIASASAILIGLSISSTQRVQGYDARHSVLPNNPAQKAAEHLAKHGRKGAWLATRDATRLTSVSTSTRVAELHNRALTRPHVDGAGAKVADYTPVNPDFIITTVARKSAEDFRYANDRLIFKRTSKSYRYLGRVEQHYHRYYDIYVRDDADIPPLDTEIVMNRAGPTPNQRQKRPAPGQSRP